MPVETSPDRLIKHGRFAHSGTYEYAAGEMPRLGLVDPPSEIGSKAMYNVYRPPQVLMNAVQEGLFTHLPLTRSHPENWVDPETFKDEIIGWTDGKVDVGYLKDSKEISVNGTVVLGDKVAIESYEQGIIDLSPGYSADFKWQKGIAPDGKPYDAVMTKINSTNHLALVNKGRGGKDSTIIDRAASGFRRVASGLWWAVKRRALVKDGDGSDPASEFTGFRSSLMQIFEGRASLSDEEIRDRVDQLRILLSDLPWGDDKDVLMRFMDDLKLMKLMPEESCQTAIQVVCALFDKLDGKAVDEASLAFGEGKGARMTKGLTLEGLLGLISRKRVQDEEKDPIECTDCHGTGKDGKGKDCAMCGGSGHGKSHDDSDDEATTEMNCEKCDGKGKIDGEDCPACKGSGKTSASEDTNPIGPHKVDTMPGVYDNKTGTVDEPDPAPAAATPAPANPPAAAAPPAAVPAAPPQPASTSPNGVPIAPPAGAAPAAAAAPAAPAQSRSAFFTAQIASIIEQMMKDPGVISEIQAQKGGQAATAPAPAAPNPATPSAPPGSAGQDPPSGAAPAGNTPPGPATATPPGPAAAAPPGPATAAPPGPSAAAPPGPDAKKPPEQPAAAAEKKDGPPAAKDEAPCEPCKGSGKIAGMECPQCKGSGKYGPNITPDPITDSASSLTALLSPSKRGGSASEPVTLENVLADITRKRR